MCRIAGIVNPQTSFETAIKQVKKMCQLQKHGGPDDEGVYSSKENNVVLGHRRLSLLDLSSAGHQPMHFLERYTITYNGELYNYKTIKEELISCGYQFKTNTDTEVILAAFAKWNTNAFVKFNGMFAFALLDKQENKIYLVRDAAGIKPMYYSTVGDSLIFASEVRSFSMFDIAKEENKNVSVFQMAYGYLPEPNTLYKNVKPLPKGTFLTYNIGTKSISLQMFNFYSFSNKIVNENEACSNIYEKVNNAVKSQMVSDAPIGVFLSGGLDSSIIAKLANDEVKNNLHTLSIYFDENKYSEKKYQDIVAQDLQSNHHSILLTEEIFHQHFPQILNAMDLPSCDGINTWFISKYASEVGLKAVLSGIGADELFGGYPSFDRMNMASKLQNIPDVLLSNTSKIVNKKYERISYLQMEGIRGLYLFLRGHFTPNEIAKQLGAYEKDIWNILENEIASPDINVADTNKASWMEFNLYMQDQLLRDADIMSMAHGLEIRVPFLDKEVVDTAFSINEKTKFSNTIKKSLLVNAFGKTLPKEIWNRPKMGFSFPFAEWLKNNEMVKAMAHNNNANTKIVVNDFMKGKLHWSKIMSLLVLQNKTNLN